MSVAAAVMSPQRTISYPDSEDSERYEIVDGVKVELPPMSVDSTRIATDLTTALNLFGVAQNLGKAYTEMLFRLPLPVERNRRPDVGFVPFSRWPKNRPFPSTSAWDVLPDLVVEVVSPFDCVEEARAKLLEYFRAGVLLVWHVLPTLQLVDVYEAPKRVTILTRDDELDGGQVIPGFRLPLRELFIGEGDAGGTSR
jgi:Uma2 family endonuclease